MAEPGKPYDLNINKWMQESPSLPSTTSNTAIPPTLYFRSSNIGQVRTMTDPPILWPTNWSEGVRPGYLVVLDCVSVPVK